MVWYGFRFQNGRRDPFDHLLSEQAAAGGRKSGPDNHKSGPDNGVAPAQQKSARKKRSGVRPNLENILEDDEAR